MTTLDRSRRNTVRDRLRALELRASKALGQNFLAEPPAAERVVACAELDGSETVLEVGPGLGALTEVLCQKGHRVIAIEIDKRLYAELQTTFAQQSNVELHLQDALTADYDLMLSDVQGKVVMISSLPYSAGGAILTRLLQTAEAISEFTVVVQQEVAQKLAATPGDKAYGVLSVIVSMYASARVAGKLSPNCFFPVPDVDSAICRLIRRDMPEFSCSHEWLMRVVASGLNQRRKTAANALSNGLGISRDQVDAALGKLEIDRQTRAEKLTLNEFMALADELYQSGHDN